MFTTYNIYTRTEDGASHKVAELGVPPQGCWWAGNFVQGPEWPEIVFSRKDPEEAFIIRADIDEDVSEEADTEWDRIMEEAKYEDLYNDLTSAGWG
jgi:hypothetical protein